MSARLSLHLGPAHSETIDDALAHIVEAVEAFGAQQQWPDGLVFKLHLLLEELGLNAINYGGATTVGITIDSNSAEVLVEVSDDGGAFNPLEDAPEPDLGAALEDRRVGGLGIHIVRSMTDHVSYRWEEGRNHLTLITRRTG